MTRQVLPYAVICCRGPCNGNFFNAQVSGLGQCAVVGVRQSGRVPLALPCFKSWPLHCGFDTTDEYKEAEISFAHGSAAPLLADAALCGAAFVLDVFYCRRAYMCVNKSTDMPDPCISKNI